ncbi:hypothetical protein [Burkholderia sp. PU8-34]
MSHKGFLAILTVVSRNGDDLRQAIRPRFLIVLWHEVDRIGSGFRNVKQGREPFEAAADDGILQMKKTLSETADALMACVRETVVTPRALGRPAQTARSGRSTANLNHDRWRVRRRFLVRARAERATGRS